VNLIQEKTRDVRFFTSLRDVEHWLCIHLEDYDWHVSDIEGGWNELNDPSWITGDALAAKIGEFDYQFSWAVISAFPKGTKPVLSDEPFADGNSTFWEGVPKVQMEGALFEIVCWDSSATLFIGLPEELATRVVNNAPGVRNLDEENRKRNR